MVNPNSDKLLEQKRKKFFEVVYRACKKRNLPRPTINFDSCEEEDENQSAHYHPNLNQICISNRQLAKLNYDNIEETATHEVTHIIEQNHESSFDKQHVTTKIGSVRVGGIYMGGGNSQNSSEEDKNEEKEIEIDKVYCKYCGKKAKLTKCMHCENYFCKEHINPCLPGGYSPEGDRYVVLINQRSTEYTKNTHPCPDYVDYLKKKEEEEKRKWGDTLNRLLGSKHKRGRYESQEIEEIQVDEEQPRKKVPHYHREYVGSRKYEEKYTDESKEIIKEQFRKEAKPFHREYIGKRKYEEEYKNEELNVDRKQKKDNFNKRLIVVLPIFISIAILLFYFYNYGQIENNPITSTKIEFEKEPTFKSIPLNVSFKKYLDNISYYNNKDINLTGFLGREIEKSSTGGVYREYIVDDFNNKIILLNLKKEQVGLFPKTGKSSEIYNVTGKFKKNYKELNLEVTNIIKSERTIILIEEK